MDVRTWMIRFFPFLFLINILPFFASAQLAKNGHADLSAFNIHSDGPLILSGTWEFYWNQLLTPDDLKENRIAAHIYVPGSWHRQGNYPVLGFATYRLKIILPEKQNGLALYIPIVNSSAKTWVNGMLAGETGKVDSSKQNYQAILQATIIALPDNAREIEIVMQVANYNYFSGGIAGIPQLDKASAIFTRINQSNGIENFFAGSLIAMCIYQLILYFLYQRGKPFLWLALVCLGVALRSLITHRGSFLLPNLFPNVGWETWKKIEFGSIYGIVALFPLYVYHLFPGHSPRKPVLFFILVAGFLCVAVIVTPQYTYGNLLDVCHLGLMGGFIYAVYSISRAWRAGSSDARIIMFGVLASFPFILSEMLKNTFFFPLNIQFKYLVEMGVLVFLLFQVYLLANHYSKSYKNLELLNQNLEKIVEERSGQLITANKVKDRLLSVISHDIKSPLNSLRSILQIYNKGAITKEEFSDYALYIENDLNKTGILVDNILYWTSSQLKGVKVKKENFDLNLLIEENVQLFLTIAANKKIVLTHNAPRHLIVRSDKNILNLVLRNLISNAIKFSHENGTISIDVQQTDSSLQIKVKDQGVGMDALTLRTLLEPESTISTTGTGNENGTGLGLILCREYLQIAGGQLTAESTPGTGSTFSIILPVK